MTVLRQRIIHESLRLFSLKGFLSTSVNDIMEAAGTSKGGFYNHFASKEDLFLQVLDEAQSTWRDRVLFGLKEIESPIGRIQRLLTNYKDRYLKDSENLPGGCIFVTLSVELDDQRPHLCQEVSKGFAGLKGMLKALLDEGKAIGELRDTVDTCAITEMLFSGMLGASVIFGAGKSLDSVDKTIESLSGYLVSLGSSQAPIPAPLGTRAGP